jgi:pyridoxal phosphate enzyme (YggS family)
MMSGISDNLAHIRLRIEASCLASGRPVDSVELIAVSKTFSQDRVQEAFMAGQLLFGENKIQEAEGKILDSPSSLEWHFIGSLQRNKVRRVLKAFDVIHSIDSFRLAAHVDEVARDLGIQAKVFLQVNIGEEESKGGFHIRTIRDEMTMLLQLERLEILGLMCIPPACGKSEQARPWFVSLRTLRDELEAEFDICLPNLSMGMSSDFEVAIEEGSTHVRVGSAIFGTR